MSSGREPLLLFLDAEYAVVGFADFQPCVAGGGLGEVLLGARDHHAQHFAVVKRVPGIGDDRFPHFFLRFQGIGGKQQDDLVLGHFLLGVL